MSYLIQELSLYLLAAFVIGASYGWRLRSMRAHREQQSPNLAAEQTIQRLQTEQQQLLAQIEQLQLIPATGAGEDWQDDYPLQVITEIEPCILHKLAEAGIESTRQLWKTCQDDDAIYALASKIAIEDFVIQRWVSIALLLRVANIKAADAILLERTEIYTLADLAAQKPARLREKLAKNNQLAPLLDDLPGQDQCAAWIEHAQHILQLDKV